MPWRKAFLWLILLLASPQISHSAPQPDPAVLYASTHKSGPEAYREAWFDEGDLRLHYVEAGSGPLIIFYHGFPSFWFHWFRQMEAFKGQYRVVAVDGLGAGLSSKPTSLEPYRVHRLARQLDALARHLNGRKRFILVGHDWGAALGFAYAQAYPDRLHAVIGMSAPPYNSFLGLVRNNPEQQKRSAYMDRFRPLLLRDIEQRNLDTTIWQTAYGDLTKDKTLSEDVAVLFRQSIANPPALFGGMNWYRANIPPFSAITEKDCWPACSTALQVPSLLVWGGADQTFVSGFWRNMPAKPGMLQVRQIKNAGHWVALERSAETNAAMAAFLASLGP